MNTNNKQKFVRPIRLARLEVGSTCRIFAEPSRGIQRSNDPTVWVRKEGNTILTDINDEERVAILLEEDLVQPLSRPANRSR